MTGRRHHRMGTISQPGGASKRLPCGSLQGSAQCGRYSVELSGAEQRALDAKFSRSLSDGSTVCGDDQFQCRALEARRRRGLGPPIYELTVLWHTDCPMSHLGWRDGRMAKRKTKASITDREVIQIALVDLLAMHSDQETQAEAQRLISLGAPNAESKFIQIGIWAQTTIQNYNKEHGSNWPDRYGIILVHRNKKEWTWALPSSAFGWQPDEHIGYAMLSTAFILDKYKRPPEPLWYAASALQLLADIFAPGRRSHGAKPPTNPLLPAPPYGRELEPASALDPKRSAAGGPPKQFEVQFTYPHFQLQRTLELGALVRECQIATEFGPRLKVREENDARMQKLQPTATATHKDNAASRKTFAIQSAIRMWMRSGFGPSEINLKETAAQIMEGDPVELMIGNVESGRERPVKIETVRKYLREAKEQYTRKWRS